MLGGFQTGRPNVVDAFASERQYAENIFPVFDALPNELRGRFEHKKNPSGGQGAMLVGSYNDLRATRRDNTIFMEHGTGQTYGDDLASYAGSTRRDGVTLFLCPNERVADINYSVHPDIPSAVIGTPKLDKWWQWKPPADVVGLAWHWDSTVCPEARSALAHYESVLGDLAKNFLVLGTAHPRFHAVAEKVYAAAGIEFTPDVKDVYETASVLVADNTSLGWDFIALDRPVIWCNAPWYRREIRHGLRFWEYVDAGIEIDEPVELAWAVEKALTNDTKHARRMEVADALYPIRDGSSAKRAAQAIVKHVGGEHGRRTAAASQR